MSGFYSSGWTAKDNSNPAAKVAVRRWLIGAVNPNTCLEVYGPRGMMYRKVWRGSVECSGTVGDSLSWLSQNELGYDIYDVDPYGSPFDALGLIGARSSRQTIGIACTDGALRRAGMMRAKLPKSIAERCGWPERDMALLAAIYHRYPSFLRAALSAFMPSYEIRRLVVTYGTGTWKQATTYFAAVMDRN